MFLFLILSSKLIRKLPLTKTLIIYEGTCAATQNKIFFIHLQIIHRSVYHWNGTLALGVAFEMGTWQTAEQTAYKAWLLFYSEKIIFNFFSQK